MEKIQECIRRNEELLALPKKVQLEYEFDSTEFMAILMVIKHQLVAFELQRRNGNEFDPETVDKLVLHLDLLVSKYAQPAVHGLTISKEIKNSVLLTLQKLDKFTKDCLIGDILKHIEDLKQFKTTNEQWVMEYLHVEHSLMADALRELLEIESNLPSQYLEFCGKLIKTCCVSIKRFIFILKSPIMSNEVVKISDSMLDASRKLCALIDDLVFTIDEADSEEELSKILVPLRDVSKEIVTLIGKDTSVPGKKWFNLLQNQFTKCFSVLLNKPYEIEQ